MCSEIHIICSITSCSRYCTKAVQCPLIRLTFDITEPLYSAWYLIASHRGHKQSEIAVITIGADLSRGRTQPRVVASGRDEGGFYWYNMTSLWVYRADNNQSHSYGWRNPGIVLNYWQAAGWSEIKFLWMKSIRIYDHNRPKAMEATASGQFMPAAHNIYRTSDIKLYDGITADSYFQTFS